MPSTLTRAICSATALLAAVIGGMVPVGTQGPSPAWVIDAARLIDGTDRPPLAPARVVVRGGHIVAVGRPTEVPAPADAERLDVGDRTVMPGLIDMHYHLEDDPRLALRQLANGVTSFRDPGEWIDVHEPLRQLVAREGLPGPRMFLTGPHIDGEHPAYPNDAYVARDPEEARRQVDRAVDQGAAAIKIYFRLSLGSALAVIDACRARGVPSTAHLEILDARDLLRAGLTGVEHITSFGTAIVPPIDAERFRQQMLADGGFRRDGRYALFAGADLDGPEAQRLYRVVEERRPFVDPTLAVFEAREGDPPPAGSELAAAVRARGFAQMQALTMRLHQHGARIVLGGHTDVPHAGRGEAPWRELELLVAAGLTPAEALRAATANGAAFLGKVEELGTLQAGRRADLIVVQGNPLQDISDVRRVVRVMMDGRWVDVERLRSF